MNNNKLEQLRSSLIHTLPKRERNKIKTLSPGLEAQRQQVMAALSLGHDLHARMERCGEVDAWDNVHYCRLPLCPRCFLRRRTCETAKAIRKTFAGRRNDELAMLTILLPVTTRLSSVGDEIARTKRRLTNMIANKRRRDPRWDYVHLTGWWEMERSDDTGLDQLGRNTRIALKESWPVLSMGATVWRPHYHGIVALGDVPLEEVVSAIRAHGHDGPYQVDVQPFHGHRPVEENIKAVVRYALRFRIEEKDPVSGKYVEGSGDRTWWSDRDITAYAEWLSQTRRGFQSLRFVIGPKKAIAETPYEKSDATEKAVQKNDPVEVVDGFTNPSGVVRVESRKKINVDAVIINHYMIRTGRDASIAAELSDKHLSEAFASGTASPLRRSGGRGRGLHIPVGSGLICGDPCASDGGQHP